MSTVEMTSLGDHTQSAATAASNVVLVQEALEKESPLLSPRAFAACGQYQPEQ